MGCKPRGMVGALETMCALQAPDLCPGGARGTTSELSLPLQVRSGDTSLEEWKGSETYSPNTAYGKTPT